jgi:hypothetical protein
VFVNEESSEESGNCIRHEKSAAELLIYLLLSGFDSVYKNLERVIAYSPARCRNASADELFRMAFGIRADHLLQRSRGITLDRRNRSIQICYISKRLKISDLHGY